MFSNCSLNSVPGFGSPIANPFMSQFSSPLASQFSNPLASQFSNPSFGATPWGLGRQVQGQFGLPTQGLIPGVSPFASQHPFQGINRFPATTPYGQGFTGLNTSLLGDSWMGGLPLNTGIHSGLVNDVFGVRPQWQGLNQLNWLSDFAQSGAINGACPTFCGSQYPTFSDFDALSSLGTPWQTMGGRFGDILRQVAMTQGLQGLQGLQGFQGNLWNQIANPLAAQWSALSNPALAGFDPILAHTLGLQGVTPWSQGVPGLTSPVSPIGGFNHINTLGQFSPLNPTSANWASPAQFQPIFGAPITGAPASFNPTYPGVTTSNGQTTPTSTTTTTQGGQVSAPQNAGVSPIAYGGVPTQFATQYPYGQTVYGGYAPISNWNNPYLAAAYGQPVFQGVPQFNGVPSQFGVPTSELRSAAGTTINVGQREAA